MNGIVLHQYLGQKEETQEHGGGHQENGRGDCVREGRSVRDDHRDGDHCEATQDDVVYVHGDVLGVAQSRYLHMLRLPCHVHSEQQQQTLVGRNMFVSQYDNIQYLFTRNKE